MCFSLLVLHTDAGIPLVLGENVSVGHRAMLHGCTIGDNTLVGIGAVILNKAVIGKNCLIGANALILENAVIPDNSLVVGSPAKVIRQIDETRVAALVDTANRYSEKAKMFFADCEKIE